MAKTGIFAALASALAAALLPACDAVNLPRIQPGITTAAEVLERMGEPGYRHGNADGTATWEYSRQPNGTQCYMISFDKRQIVSRLEQVLSDEYFARVQPGMSRDEIRRLLGAPATHVVFPNLREEIWEWRIEGMPVMDLTYFSVSFDADSGLVKKVGRRVEVRG
ncbi:MAG: outer membrane protein assembly factor BamE [Betaproteobacteria bacterium]|nr:outer membrane protein assembly factor BamE [Betaproteobacteria bacterium]MCL2887658.1 outer membrane protein assembly factor BamE [Betaproteobacteria bacterium]